jgi:hypothetical protein
MPPGFLHDNVSFLRSSRTSPSIASIFVLENSTDFAGCRGDSNRRNKELNVRQACDAEKTLGGNRKYCKMAALKVVAHELIGKVCENYHFEEARRIMRGLSWLGCTMLLAVGCTHTNSSCCPPTGCATATGYAPAPGGCSSCGSSPISAMPHYAPPTPAPPPIATQPTVLASPVVTNQVQFRPAAPVARFGTVEVEETNTVPLPPNDVPALPGDNSLETSDSKMPYITLKK